MSVLIKLQEGFTNEDHNYLRVLQVIRNQGQKVLYQVLLWGWPKDVPVKNMAKHFLIDLPQTGKIKLKIFDKTQQSNIKADPTGEAYDVTLLHKCIKIACVGLAPFEDDAWKPGDDTRLESLVTQIKTMRNDLFHNVSSMDNKTMFTNIEEIRKVLIKTIQAAGLCFHVDAKETKDIIDKVNYNVNAIRDAELAQGDIKKYQKELLHEHLKTFLKKNGSQELKKRIKKLMTLNPFHFLDGSNYCLEVGNVFSKIEIEQGNGGTKNQEIEYRDILRLSESCETISSSASDNEAVTLILLEGQAGYGKTTMFKFILSDWESGTNSIKHLASFDLVLPIMCRDSHVSTFSELLSSLMPGTLTSFRNIDEFIVCTSSLRLLVVVDGLNEMTKESGKVFDDLLSRMKFHDMTVLCTSRPETVDTFFYRRVPSELKKVHLKIRGIPVELRGDFVQKYHDEMIKKSKSKKSTAGLVEYINRTSSKLQHHFISPLNLVLLTHLWSLYPDLVNSVTTATELYSKVDMLRTEELRRRLTTSYTNLDLINDCKRFEKALFAEALISISKNDANLPEESKRRLRKTCDELKLDFEKVLFHFLVMKGTFTVTGRSEVITFPHQDIQDYYGAKCLYFALLNDNYFSFIKHSVLRKKLSSWKVFFGFEKPVASLPEALPEPHPFQVQRTISEILEVVHDTDSIVFSRYCNVLKHLAGLLGQHVHQVPDELSKELLKLFSNAGIVSRDSWLDILKEVKCDASTSKYIASFVSQSCKGHIYVNDEEVGIYASLMPHSKPEKVTLELISNSSEIPRLPELLRAVGNHEGVKVALKFHYDFVHGQELDHLLDHLKSEHGDIRCNLKALMGHVSDMTILPITIEELALSIRNDEDAKKLKSLIDSLPTTLPSLNKMDIFLTNEVSLTAMPALPQLTYPTSLFFSRMEPELVEWACHMMGGIQSHKGFMKVTLREGSLSLEEVSELVKGIKSHGVKIVDELRIFSPSLGSLSADLATLVKSELGCTLTVNSRRYSKLYTQVPNLH
ncbi:uncharacterized protein LOC125037889 [Penaeus chinensis]|uniref:uncharacterized protein LOC125037889 n=1 Tax=Penaeus chinensis TaxID=139456 RepID=UPI001FB630C0|nr:uncharacterized protein LOC125037889 [Penaeus chinensis]